MQAAQQAQFQQSQAALRRQWAALNALPGGSGGGGGGGGAGGGARAAAMAGGGLVGAQYGSPYGMAAGPGAGDMAGLAQALAGEAECQALARRPPCMLYPWQPWSGMTDHPWPLSPRMPPPDAARRLAHSVLTARPAPLRAPGVSLGGRQAQAPVGGAYMVTPDMMYGGMPYGAGMGAMPMPYDVMDPSMAAAPGAGRSDGGGGGGRGGAGYAAPGGRSQQHRGGNGGGGAGNGGGYQQASHPQQAGMLMSHYGQQGVYVPAGAMPQQQQMQASQQQGQQAQQQYMQAVQLQQWQPTMGVQAMPQGAEWGYGGAMQQGMFTQAGGCAASRAVCQAAWIKGAALAGCVLPSAWALSPRVLIRTLPAINTCRQHTLLGPLCHP